MRLQSFRKLQVEHQNHDTDVNPSATFPVCALSHPTPQKPPEKKGVQGVPPARPRVLCGVCRVRWFLTAADRRPRGRVGLTNGAFVGVEKL